MDEQLSTLASDTRVNGRHQHEMTSGICTLNAPAVIATATDTYLLKMRPTNVFPDAINLPGVAGPRYGQDLAYSYGRKFADGDYNQGPNPSQLQPKMRDLLRLFAPHDTTGAATRLFDRFLQKLPQAEYFDDRDLNRAVAVHPNIRAFCAAALGAPAHGSTPGGRSRIHQALKNARWDINKIKIPTDLGVPALNRGSPALGSGDYGNGLGLMINGIQHAYCVARQYCYDSRLSKYKISIRFIFYDVFGLDDDDLVEYGADNRGTHNPPAARRGITAWWQLQHQHGYAPLVTRMMVDRNYEVEAT